MSSLRGRLFLILVATTSLIWLAATGWIYLGTKNELEQMLDTRLQEAARMVASLVQDDTSAQTAIAAAPPVAPPETGSYERQLSCQIWSLGGRLVAASTTAPAERLATHGSGFHDSVINGELWRVYAIEDAAKGVRVLVGDRLGLRERLVQDLVLGLVAPTLLMLPLFAGLIWLSVGRGLAPLRQIAGDLQNRPADDLSPVGANAVREIRPLTEALNGLFRRLDSARRHERGITAFAAHELRTPLAGIRMQAQIAKAADNDAMRLAALGKIEQGVDRTARLISQLLTLARLDADAAGSDRQRIRVGPLLRDIDGERRWPELMVEIDPALDEFVVWGEPDSLRLALRNLHENACGHSPAGGRVRWLRIAENALAVEDDGPGIPDEEMPLVRQRFYRARSTKTAGTGLGLSIVEVALARLGATLTLENRAPDAGLRAMITAPSRAHLDRPGGSRPSL
jgi:two-component system sensor histidine kinase QseC